MLEENLFFPIIDWWLIDDEYHDDNDDYDNDADYDDINVYKDDDDDVLHLSSSVYLMIYTAWILICVLA